MTQRKYKLGTFLIISIGILVLFVVFLGIYSHFQTESLHGQTETMYEHPLKVRKAVDVIQTSVQEMRLETRNLMLASNKQEQENSIKNSSILEAHIYEQFTVIKAAYLGPKQDVNQAFDAFVAWSVMRKENADLALKGQISEIKKNVADNGKIGSLRAKLLEKLFVIDQYAQNKADSIYKRANDLKNEMQLYSIIIIVVMLLISIIILIILIRQINDPIKELTIAATELKNGNYKTRISDIPNNEYRILSDAFNSLAERLQNDIELNEQESKLSQIMISEEDDMTFFQKLLPALATYTNSQITCFYLLSEDRKNFEHYMSFGAGDKAKTSFSAESHEGEFGYVLSTKQIEHVQKIPKETKFVFNTTTVGIIPREIINIPIISGNIVVGIFSLASVRSYSESANNLLHEIYDVLNARVIGILALKQLKNSANELTQISSYNRSLIENSSDPFVVISEDGKVKDSNSAIEKITGLTKNQISESDFSAYFSRPEKAREVYLQTLMNGMVRNYELYINSANGKKIPVLINATLYTDKTNNELTVLATLRDITESKRIENELIRLNDYLTQKTDELKKLNTELESQKSELSNQSIELAQQNSILELQKSQLDEANKLKSNFLSSMSHELRTPLNSVIALSGVLHRRLIQKIATEELGYLEVIERNGKHLLTLINDILDISRIEAGRIDIEISDFDINHIVSEIIYMIKPQADLKNIELNHHFPDHKVIVNSDISKCNHILQNLIGNAVKFTETGKVDVEVTTKDQEIRISVTDTGIGIAAQHLDHIFDEFRQADGSTSRKYGGSGLGLSIAKKYAEMLNGTITVSSKLNEGSEFTLTLPYKFEEQDSSKENVTINHINPDFVSTAENYSRSQKKIMIIEDSEPAIIQLNEFLTEAGFSVLIARDGQSALNMLTFTIPDGIILDLMMPGIDGFAVLKAIRESERTEQVPVLILTAKHITKDELSFLKKNHVYQLIQKGNVEKTQLLQHVTQMIDLKTGATDNKNVEQNSNKQKVLIIDDNENNRRSIVSILNTENFETYEAKTGEDGVSMAFEVNPDIIFLDIALPDIDGFVVCNLIRKQEKTQNIPIVALSTNTVTDNYQTYINKGFNAVTQKPIDKESLIQNINNLVHGK